MLWIPVTILAALAQTARFSVQRRLRLSTLSSAGATFARFVYAGPLIVGLALAYEAAIPAKQTQIDLWFWVYAVLGGAAQIGGTMCIVALFTLRHFTVGVTFMKSEVLITALLGFVLLGEAVTPWALVAMLIGVAAVLVLSKAPLDRTLRWSDVFQRATVLGVASGVLFGFCSVMYRGATQMVLSDDPLFRSTQTLMYVILIQSVMMAVYLALFEKGQIRRVLRAWKVAIWVGIFSLAGSFGWFTAFALQNAAYVKALGQIEIVFSLAVAAVLFGERMTRREACGVALMGCSVVGLVLAV
ncbi:MAG: DMT family transporter [Pseudomonadota bacterium]